MVSLFFLSFFFLRTIGPNFRYGKMAGGGDMSTSPAVVSPRYYGVVEILQWIRLGIHPSLWGWSLCGSGHSQTSLVVGDSLMLFCGLVFSVPTY
jgi:hypothetical protein